MIRSAVAAFPYGFATLLPPTRARLRFEELKPEIRRLQQEHHDDAPRRGEALMELYRRHGLSPFAGFVRALLMEALADVDLLLALRDAYRRGLADRAANTLVMRTRSTTFS